jgi:hypothetical protein
MIPGGTPPTAADRSDRLAGYGTLYPAVVYQLAEHPSIPTLPLMVVVEILKVLFSPAPLAAAIILFILLKYRTTIGNILQLLAEKSEHHKKVEGAIQVGFAAGGAAGSATGASARGGRRADCRRRPGSSGNSVGAATTPIRFRSDPKACISGPMSDCATKGRKRYSRIKTGS